MSRETDTGPEKDDPPSLAESLGASEVRQYGSHAEAVRAEMGRRSSRETDTGEEGERLEPVMAFNEALWRGDVKGNDGQLGWCDNDAKHHFHRPECTNWRGLWRG